MAKRTKISADDKALFRTLFDDVTPLQQNRIPPHRRPPPPTPRRHHDEEPPMAETSFSDGLEPAAPKADETLEFSRSGLQHKVLSKLRRGQYPIAAELDLHGMRVEEARLALGQFLHHCTMAKMQCVRIIHGKGYGSQQNHPVLKGRVNHWLRQRAEVLAFFSAQPKDGGTGALYLLLKRT